MGVNFLFNHGPFLKRDFVEFVANQIQCLGLGRELHEVALLFYNYIGIKYKSWMLGGLIKELNVLSVESEDSLFVIEQKNVIFYRVVLNIHKAH